MDHAERLLEGRIARILTWGTLGAVALLAIGSVAMLATGTSPLGHGPALDPGRLVPDVVALRPAGVIWLGLLVVIATPAARVVTALAGYLHRGERGMAAVAALVLVVIAIGVVAGTVGS